MRASAVARSIAALVAPLFAGDVYFNDFNGAPGRTYPEWTTSGYTNSANQAGTVGAGLGPQAVAPVAETLFSPSGPMTHGICARGSDGDADAALSEPQTHATVIFDLYILKSWDGNNPNYGPDRWRLRVRGGATLLDTTFSNNPKTGAYDLSQQEYPAAASAQQTGCVAVNTLGYRFFGDCIYRLTFRFAHAAATLALDFSSSLFEGKGTDDESWGLDNVRVATDAGGPLP